MEPSSACAYLQLLLPTHPKTRPESGRNSKLDPLLKVHMETLQRLSVGYSIKQKSKKCSMRGNRKRVAKST